jgi:hypothetical protein
LNQVVFYFSRRQRRRGSLLLSMLGAEGLKMYGSGRSNTAGKSWSKSPEICRTQSGFPKLSMCRFQISSERCGSTTSKA